MLIWADFKGAELFALAVLSNDARLLDHVTRNALPEDDPNFYDLHSQIAVTAFRLDCAPTKEGLSATGKAFLRVVAKSIIFGMLYGRGAAAVAEEVKEQSVFITKEEAQQVMNAIRKTYPQAMTYLDEAAERICSVGWIAGVCRRYRRKPKHDYLPEDKLAAMQRVAKNFPMQNFVAEAMNKSLQNLYYYRFDHEVDYSLLLQVHDEVVLSAPYKDVEYVADIVIPFCMSEKVKLYARRLDGTIDRTRGPYSMAIDVSVGHRYSCSEKDWRETCRANAR
jgi:DNA polymerase-1